MVYFFRLIVSLSMVAVSVVTLAHNVLALGEGGDYYHKTSYEAPNFKFSKNCHTKH